MLGLNIRLNSFEFYGNLINKNETIRVSITTLPDSQKQACTIDVNKLKAATVSFTVRFSENTQRIVIVFRKKASFGNDRLIASVVFNSDEFPKLFNSVDNYGMRKIDIYEPLQHMSNKNNNSFQSRKVVGRMIGQFVLLDKYAENENKIKAQSKNNNKIEKPITKLLGDNDNLLFQDLMTN